MPEPQDNIYVVLVAFATSVLLVILLLFGAFNAIHRGDQKPTKTWDSSKTIHDIRP